MPEYHLEIKQVVDYPRCRIYREFIHSLIADRNIRTNGSSGLFHYTVLCSYANFRTSYRRLDGISYTVYPGEWVCRLSELVEHLRLRTQRGVLQVLEKLQERNYIQFTLLGRGHLVKYRIKGWRRHNTVLDYNCPCQKETGFFFLPISIASELISMERCSEMDIILDLWLSAVYNDTQVQGSFAGPVAYFRNGSGCPLISYSELAQRWGISKATVGRILKKLEDQQYLTLLTFPGRHGTAIYLQNYLSTMFQISDVLVDKEEVAMSLNIKIHLEEESPYNTPSGGPLADTLCSGANRPIIVSESNLDLIAAKVLKVLEMQGIACSKCDKSTYKLYPLSGDCKGALEVSAPQGAMPRLCMELFCSDGTPVYTFELTMKPLDD